MFIEFATTMAQIRVLSNNVPVIKSINMFMLFRLPKKKKRLKMY